MAVSGIQPFIKVIDSNGDPIVGAKLKVYEAGTTTYRNIYSDSSLTIALTNPLSGSDASNASGDFPRFYMASGTYKLRAETSVGVLIWEFDNIDTGLSAGVGALPISAGGTGATTAAAARASLDVPSNSELADLADDIATLSSSIQNIVSFPQGRLTLTTGVPAISSSVSAGTAVYYTFYVGNIVPVYDGTQYNSRTFPSDLTLTLNSNHIASAIYDVFIYWDGSALQIASGVAWNSAAAGSGSRGSGAGTTELVRVNGLWVNKYDISRRNGATTGTILANQGTYVGSIYMDGTNGQISCHTSYGQSRKWGVWNAYSRVPILLTAGDGTASWSNTPNTWRQSRADSTNFATAFCGLPEELIIAEFSQNVIGTYTGTGLTAQIGIGLNATNAANGRVGFYSLGTGGTNSGTTATLKAETNIVPSIGINNLNMVEQTLFGTTGVQYDGTATHMQLSLKWRG